MQMNKEGLVPLIQPVVIYEKVRDLGIKIHRKFACDPHPLIVVIVLDGAFMFGKDLVDILSKMNHAIDIRFIKASSYNGGTTSSKAVGLKLESLYSLGSECKTRNVVVVEDIIDTGRTYQAIINALKRAEFLSITYCPLIWKDYGQCVVDIDEDNLMYGFKCPDDKFLVGYGLDYNNMFRHLPAIYEVTDPSTLLEVV